jgi:hypothetical protein
MDQSWGSSDHKDASTFCVYQALTQQEEEDAGLSPSARCGLDNNSRSSNNILQYPPHIKYHTVYHAYCSKLYHQLTYTPGHGGWPGGGTEDNQM